MRGFSLRVGGWVSSPSSWIVWLSAVVCACGPAAPVREAASTLPEAAAPAVKASESLPGASANSRKPKVIVCVWDGLRPDSITEQATPNLARLRDHDSVNFTDHHSVYPTFTMMNAAALATGAYPAQHGFYGNTEYQPGPVGKNADGKLIEFFAAGVHRRSRRPASARPVLPRARGA